VAIRVLKYPISQNRCNFSREPFLDILSQVHKQVSLQHLVKYDLTIVFPFDPAFLVFSPTTRLIGVSSRLGENSRVSNFTWGTIIFLFYEAPPLKFSFAIL